MHLYLSVLCAQVDHELPKVASRACHPQWQVHCPVVIHSYQNVEWVMLGLRMWLVTKAFSTLLEVTLSKKKEIGH